jgi:hypothetical protein
VDSVIGDMGFGLDGDEDEIRLLDANGIVIDRVRYSDEDPWPDSPDGDGNTLELVNPQLDNYGYQNWRASDLLYGTPGNVNSVYTDAHERPFVPRRWRLVRTFPNPFNSETVIQFEVPRALPVKLTVYDILGRTVQTLDVNRPVAGLNTIQWSGKSSRGAAVGSGVYFVRMTSPVVSTTHKLILLR